MTMVSHCGAKALRRVAARLHGLLTIGTIASFLLATRPVVAQDPPAAKEKDVAAKASPKNPFPGPKPKAPPLEGGLGWLNSAGPIEISKLKGKVVLLDFWTYCCINCMHILPDLAKLEEEFPNELVVIGVHSAKFEGEKDTQNIRDAVLRYGIKHPVVNDGKMEIWRNYGVRAWPTRMLIDPEGNVIGALSGEGHYETFHKAIEKLIEYHAAKGTLDRKPLHFQLESFGTEKTPLRFPGKVVADPAKNRLFISDSSHNRVVIAHLDSGKVDQVIGDGIAGFKDGDFASARFDDPQGLAFAGDVLYVADRRNHSIRRVDLAAKKVTTIAGTGKQGFERDIKAKGTQVSLASPWDLLIVGPTMYIAMAGTHQIWTLNLESGEVGNYAGSGREDIINGQLDDAAFAQPSGLATDGRHLFVADSEVSAVRSIDLQNGTVDSLVGEGLFEFGDVDGKGAKARLQHALGVAFDNGKVYVADTYNNKIKTIDPSNNEAKTYLGDGKPGTEDEPPRFDEPGGISIVAGKAYVADTNNHRIRVIDLGSGKVTTFPLEGLYPPAEPESEVNLEADKAQAVDGVTLKSGGKFRFEGSVIVPEGQKLNPMSPMSYAVSFKGTDGKLNPIAKGRIKPVSKDFAFEVSEISPDVKDLMVAVTYYPCEEGSEGVCRVETHAWKVPVTRPRKGAWN
ncbi:MAG: thioredoxin-like domain-containing protein [Planctomycetota bacterium]